ncbi:MAG: hypothetical protein LBU04_05025 [Christensenellaceae bacterium]|jgi:hypothetical protein|nr:hypothetical protein [Christensenellaceae bacterium]
MFNTNTAKTNDKMYVTDIVGENIGDLLITGIQYNCFSIDEVPIEGTTGNYVCVFNFTVKPMETWVSNDIVRKISQISFKIIDTSISVHVSVNIFEGADNSNFIDNCPILNNAQYLTLVKRASLSVGNKLSFTLALNWRIQGWGGNDGEDDKYASIVGFRFANSALSLESFAVVVDNDEGVFVPERKDFLDLSNVMYNLTSRRCYWSGNFVEFEVSIVGETYQIVSDSLIMLYTLNGGTDIYEVNLSTVQIYNYDALLNWTE